MEELAILNEVASAISSTMSLDGIVALIIEKCVKHMHVEQGAVMLLKEDESNSPFRTMVRKMDSGVDVVPYRFGDQLTGWMLKNQKPLLINDLQGVLIVTFPVESAGKFHPFLRLFQIKLLLRSLDYFVSLRARQSQFQFQVQQLLLQARIGMLFQ